MDYHASLNQRIQIPKDLIHVSEGDTLSTMRGWETDVCVNVKNSRTVFTMTKIALVSLATFPGVVTCLLFGSTAEMDAAVMFSVRHLWKAPQESRAHV